MSLGFVFLLQSYSGVQPNPYAGVQNPSVEMQESKASGISVATPFTVLVTNSVTPDTPDKLYKTSVAAGGTLFDGLKNLQDSNQGFTFTYKNEPPLGPFLESVNGLYGSEEEHTFWELLAKKPDGKMVPLDVGMGKYKPMTNEEIILKYTKYQPTGDSS